MSRWPNIYAIFLASVWILQSCEKPHEKVVAVFDNGQPRVAMLVTAQGEEIERRTWHGNGIIATETRWKQGRPHGDFRRFGTDGVVYEEGGYREGLRQGTWTTWYGRGKKESQGSYRDDLREGRWEGLYPDKSLAWERYYRNDTAVGIWRSYSANGLLIEENSCHSGEKVGFLRRWSPLGKLEIYQECRSGLRHGLWMDYYPGGALRRVGRYQQDTQDSLWSVYRADGSLWKVENWKQGLRHGNWVWLGSHHDTLVHTVFDQGTGTFGEPCALSGKWSASRMLCAETTWVRGAVHGSSHAFSENQLYLRFEDWESGEKVLSRDFRVDSNGQPTVLASEGHWKNGRREGVWRNWYSNGILKDSLHYHAGEFYGDQFHFDAQGHLYMKKNTRGKKYPVLMETLDPQPAARLEAERSTRSR